MLSLIPDDRTTLPGVIQYLGKQLGLDWPMGGSKRGYKGYAETMCLETVLKLIVRYEPLFIMNCNNGSHNGRIVSFSMECNLFTYHSTGCL